MRHYPLTAIDRSLLQLAAQRRDHVLSEGQLANKLAEQHHLTNVSFWTRVAILRQNPEARAKFPATVSWLDTLHERGVARRSRGTAA